MWDKSNNIYICLCVCVGVCARLCVSACLCVYTCGCWLGHMSHGFPMQEWISSGGTCLSVGSCIHLTSKFLLLGDVCIRFITEVKYFPLFSFFFLNLV